MSLQGVPKDCNSVSPYIMAPDVRKIIEFLTATFHAEPMGRHERPDGTIAHAQMKIGDSVVMLAEPTGSWKAQPVTVHIYVEDVDAAFERALDAGATALNQPQDQFYGDRGGGVKDEFGNTWWISTHFEEVSDEEMTRRAAEVERRKVALA